jgi:hypothetical protein
MFLGLCTACSVLHSRSTGLLGNMDDGEGKLCASLSNSTALRPRPRSAKHMTGCHR